MGQRASCSTGFTSAVHLSHRQGGTFSFFLSTLGCVRQSVGGVSATLPPATHIPPRHCSRYPPQETGCKHILAQHFGCMASRVRVYFPLAVRTTAGRPSRRRRRTTRSSIVPVGRHTGADPVSGRLQSATGVVLDIIQMITLRPIPPGGMVPPPRPTARANVPCRPTSCGESAESVSSRGRGRQLKGRPTPAAGRLAHATMIAGQISG